MRQTRDELVDVFSKPARTRPSQNFGLCNPTQLNPKCFEPASPKPDGRFGFRVNPKNWQPAHPYIRELLYEVERVEIQ